MKLLPCFALFFAGYAQAGELLPMSGEECDELQEAIDEQLKPVVDALPSNVTVEPVLIEADISGRTKRIFLGPLAGGSNIEMIIRVTNGSDVTEHEISDEAGAWKGTFFPGQDYEMIDRVVAAAISVVQSYSGNPIETSEHPAGSDGADGLDTAPAVPLDH